MERREFLRYLGVGFAAAWALGRLTWPLAALAGKPDTLIALLGDAHLQDGDPSRAEARALARAVAQIRALRPAPDLVLFAGDLAHNGNTGALELGKEILSDLPTPLFMVMGEGDGLPEAAATCHRMFGEPWFSYALPPSPRPSPPAGERESLMTFSGETLISNLLQKTENRKQKTVHIIGLNTTWCPGPGGPEFHLGEAQRRWLARELARLDPDVPLLVLSHAPLYPIFRPWQQWTADAHLVTPLLARFRQVLCLHGHVHGAVVSGQWSVVSAANRKQKTENHSLQHGLLATAWPLPQALQGTPTAPGPGLGPRGCGWGLVSLGPNAFKFQPHLWQA